MLNVGLTGNIASGKSSVADLWARRGATVIDADRLARRAVEPGSEGLRRIVETWGETILRPDGSLDRDALRETVFRDEAERARLEAVVHPEVSRLRGIEVAAAEARGDRVVVADVPLLFEVGLEREFDLVVFVDADESIRLDRLVRLRGLDPHLARRMIQAQLPAREKRTRADYVIRNDGSLDELEERASEVWREIEARARSNERPR